MDANFRLKRKDVSSEEADPGLGTGWSFFCDVTAYMAHLADNWDKPQEVHLNYGAFVLREALTTDTAQYMCRPRRSGPA